MSVLSWLESVQLESTTDAELRQLQFQPESRKRKRPVRQRQRQRQMPTPSTAANPNATPPPPNKRRRPEYDNDGDDDNIADPDTDRTPRGRGVLSHSSRTSSRSSRSSRTSPTKRLAHLAIAPVNPVLVTQISRSDGRLPAELETMLDALEGFQSRVGIVPGYLAAEIEARAKEDRELYNFQPSKFQQAEDAATGTTVLEPTISLDRVLEVFSAAKECFNHSHSEAGWNTLVHWPVFQLALGPITGGAAAAAAEDTTQSLGHQVRVRAMPCTTATLQGRPRGAKLVDYCIFVEPHGVDAQQVDEILEMREYINHTDYLPLRRRPIVLSAESKKPGEGYTDAQIQLGVWQAAQWALLESLIASRPTQPALIPFLPALIIQGHEWAFAATTKSGRHTVLWVKQAIGATDTVLGVFQIIHALRYIATWIRGTYWPWYKHIILQMPEDEGVGG